MVSDVNLSARLRFEPFSLFYLVNIAILVFDLPFLMSVHLCVRICTHGFSDQHPLAVDFYLFLLYSTLQCFDAVGWAAGTASGL